MSLAATPEPSAPPTNPVLPTVGRSPAEPDTSVPPLARPSRHLAEASFGAGVTTTDEFGPVAAEVRTIASLTSVTATVSPAAFAAFSIAVRS